MKSQFSLPLAPFTTFCIGGPARIFIEAHPEEDIHEAIVYAHTLNLPLYPLGAGSNILVPDAGVEGVVLKMTLRDMKFEQNGDETILIAGAGTLWEEIIDAASERNLFGIENLAGIPGTLGGASVQNIGAYGAELSDVFVYADCLDSSSGTHKRIERVEASFAYRTSFFKTHQELIIVRVALRLSKQITPNIAYPDLARAHKNGFPLSTPSEIARAIRAIRAKKFPSSLESHTAGSFFKNPVISRAHAYALTERFSDLPLFPQEDGTIKISLAWILDRALFLKGFSKGRVRLYEEQPLIVVAQDGATATEVDSFADEIAERVLAATGIAIEREVETFGARSTLF